MRIHFWSSVLSQFSGKPSFSTATAVTNGYRQKRRSRCLVSCRRHLEPRSSRGNRESAPFGQFGFALVSQFTVTFSTELAVPTYLSTATTVTRCLPGVSEIRLL